MDKRILRNQKKNTRAYIFYQNTWTVENVYKNFHHFGKRPKKKKKGWGGIIC